MILFATKNLQLNQKDLRLFLVEFTHVDSMSGLIKKIKKVDFEYPPPNLLVSNLGYHEALQKYIKLNFPNSQLY